MPIKNRGLFNLTEVSRRQIETDWPAANTNYDLNINSLVANSNILARNIVVNSITSNTWSRIFTANVTESSSNLYFTNSRVVSALIAGNNITIEANGRISSTAITGMNLSSNTTTHLAEGANLYYTNARVFSNVIPLLNLKANISSLTTANVIELSNLYYTNARVYSNVIPLLDLKANVTDLILKANVTDLILKANVTDLTTSNVAERNNLYYTNDRVRSAFTAGTNITIESNGRISANTNLSTIISSSTAVAQSGTLTYDMGVALGNAQNIMVIVEGLIQIPNTDYSVSGSNLIFTDQPPVGANIEVKLFGISALSAGENISISNDGRISVTDMVSTIILLTNTTIYSNITIPTGKNGLSVGPVTVVNGANVTITPGQRWLVL